MTELDTSVSALKKSSPVHIVDFDIPFGQMVWLLVKWSLAAVPALFALPMIGGVIAALFGAFISSR